MAGRRRRASCLDYRARPYGGSRGPLMMSAPRREHQGVRLSPGGGGGGGRGGTCAAHFSIKSLAAESAPSEINVAGARMAAAASRSLGWLKSPALAKANKPLASTHEDTRSPVRLFVCPPTGSLAGFGRSCKSGAHLHGAQLIKSRTARAAAAHFSGAASSSGRHSGRIPRGTIYLVAGAN